MRDRVARWALPAAAFCAAFLPDAGSPFLPALASVPWYVQGAVVGLLAAGAARTAPGRRWPLFVVAAADAVVRAPWFLLSVASYVAATTYRRPLHLAVFTLVTSLLAIVPQPGVGVDSSLGGAPLTTGMIRVLIVDDEALVRTGLRMILEAAGDIEVVAEAENGAEAVTAVAAYWPHVVLMDVQMPRMDGVAALREINRSPDPPKVVMLTTFDLDEYVYGALRAKAAGFLLKDTAPRDLIAAVRAVADGSAILAPAVTRRLIDAFAGAVDDGADAQVARRRLAVLTGRERDVVEAVARGLSNAEIARELDLTETTVKAHVSRSLAKLGLANRVQIALLVRDAGQGGALAAPAPYPGTGSAVHRPAGAAPIH